MDIYQAVTDRIITQLEQGQIPWRKPWIASGSALSYSTGKPYSLLNQMLLGRPGEYLTFHECKRMGGHVRKGAKSSIIVFWRWLDADDDDEEPEQGKEQKKIPLLRYYNVFHVDQCEGINPKHTHPMPNVASPVDEADEIIRSYIDRSGVTLHHQEGDRAFYQPSTDCITLPNVAQFISTSEYYSTLFHELTHSTGHPSRLNRITKPASFGSNDYSKEELIAEIGSAALVNHTGLETPESFNNSSAYIQSWLHALKDDKRLIVSAAGKAEKAVNLILGI